MAVKTILIAAFAALVAAVPQNAEHLGKAQVARSNNIFARSDLEGRMISYDGSCGSWSGYTCPDGGCCSSQGWCGSTALHCGAGCQVGFGQCSTGGDTSPAPAPAQSPAPAETPSPVAPAAQPTTTSATTVAPTTPATTPVVAATSIGVNGGNAPAQNPDKGNDHTIPLPITTAWTAPTTTAAPAPAQTTATSGSNLGLGDTYKLYTGDGSLAAGWPAQSEWVDFDTAFENNRGLMSQSCAQFGAANNNNDEINMLKSALQSVGSSSGVDPRFLLAIVMQESGGCVRAPTTNYGVRNPGLFQSHDGSGTCNDSGNVQNPCASSEITQMVTDGADGTAAGDGLKQTLAEAGTSDVSKYYRAARIYNSGSIASSGQLQDGIATHCYSSDVANRLTGWVHAAHGCSQ